MNKNQYKLISARLIQSTVQRKAVELCIFENMTAADAERRIHGKITATVARDVKRVNELFEFVSRVIAPTTRD